MPRYFFTIEQAGSLTERMTADLPDIEHARQYALGIVEIVTGGSSIGADATAWRVLIQSRDGSLLRTMTPSDVGKADPRHH